MATANLVSTAEAVKTAINAASEAGTLSQSFRAERSYADWDAELKDLDALRVDVVSLAHEEIELATRTEIQYLCPVQIGIRKRFSRDDQRADRISNDEIDALVLLVEDIVDLLTPDRLATYTTAVWEDVAVQVIAPREHLREWRQFTAIIRVRFDVTRDLT